MAEQQKIQREHLLIQQQQSFEYNNTAFPLLSSPHPTNQTTNSQVNVNVASNNDQHMNKPSYASIIASKSKNNLENVEQIMLVHSNSNNRHLTNISALLASQLTNLVTKIDEYSQRTHKINNQIQEVIIPKIQEMARMIDVLSHQNSSNPSRQYQEQDATTSCSDRIKFFLTEYQAYTYNAPSSKRRKQQNNLSQTQTNILN